jgi:hypothetical protein
MLIPQLGFRVLWAEVVHELIEETFSGVALHRRKHVADRTQGTLISLDLEDLTRRLETQAGLIP